jgi:hypothetical protein
VRKREVAWHVTRGLFTYVVLPGVSFLAGTGVDNWLGAFREIGRLEAKLEAKEVELGGLRTENARLLQSERDAIARNELLSRYGADFTLYRRWQIGIDEGEVLPLGRCEAGPCFISAFGGLKHPGEPGGPAIITFVPPNGTPLVLVGVSSRNVAVTANTVLGIPLRKGCRSFVYTERETLQFEVEDDRHTSVVLGVVVKPADASQKGQGGVGFGGTCPSVGAAAD